MTIKSIIISHILTAVISLVLFGCAASNNLEKKPELSNLTPEVTEYVPASDKTKEAIDQQFHKRNNKAKLYRAYNRYLRRDKYLGGKIVFAFIISPNGFAVNCMPISNKTGNNDLARDLCKIIEGIDFGNNFVSKNERIEYPIDLVPADKSIDPDDLDWTRGDINVKTMTGRENKKQIQKRLLRITQKPQSRMDDWFAINIVIPDQWSIKEITIGIDSISLINESGEIYQLNSTNFEELVLKIRKSHPVTNEQLLSIWQEFAVVRN